LPVLVGPRTATSRAAELIVAIDKRIGPKS